MSKIPDLYWSIHLGGQAVLGGSTAAIAAALKRLPPRKAGDRDAPFALPLHSAFHTPLMAATATRARHDLAGLGWQSPRLPLIDGHGRIHHPAHGDPAVLRDWTLGAQVVTPYDFTTSLCVALYEYAPDAVVLLGPGGNLGGACAQVMIGMRWRGIDSRAAFLHRQAEDPIVIAMARPEQRVLVTSA